MSVDVMTFSAYGGTRLPIHYHVCGELGVKYQMAVCLIIVENVEEKMSVITYPLDSMNHLNRGDNHSLGIPSEDDPMFTLSKQHHHAVVIVKNVEDSMDQLTLSLEEVPANHSASQDSEREWMTRVATSRSPILQSLTSIAPSGLSGKTYPVSCHLTEDGILVPSSGRWMRSGTGMRGECWTLNTQEHPTIRGLSLNDDGVSSLSDVLETGEVPKRYFLTAKACAGILRRAEKRGKELPPLLKQALEAMAFDTTQITSPGNFSVPKDNEACHPLVSTAHAPALVQAMAFEPGSIARNAGPAGEDEVCPTLRKEMGDNQPAVRIEPNTSVRRLTPTECERLQGFPDGWTQIPWRKKTADDCPDGPRYKAIGNSMAVNVMQWIGIRIAMVEEIHKDVRGTIKTAGK